MAPLLVLAAGALGLLVMVLYQRRQIAELAERVAAASRFDPVTGLLNRRAFEEMLQFEIDRSRRTGRSLALIVGEVDGMPRLNAARGHGAGDVALKQTGEHGAFLVAERLRRATRRTFAQGSLPLTISFGVASYPDHGEEFGVLMGAAARAVDAAVELGRDRSVAYCRDVARMLDELPDPSSTEPRLSSIIGLAEELDVRDTG